MKNDLDLVIAALEAEKRSLQKMIRRSTSEYDHLIAYHQSEALLQLNHHLRILHSFKDPFYNQREELKRREKFLQHKPKSFDNKGLWEFFKKRRLQEIEEGKLELEAKHKNKSAFNDSQQIDDLLFAITDGTINTFKIIVTLYDDVELLFTREVNFLMIWINSYDPHEPDFIFENRPPDPLKGLEFEYDADKRSWVYKYDLLNFKDATDIKILLSRLFFDVFNVYDVKQPIIIKYPEA